MAGEEFTNPTRLPSLPDAWRVAAIEELCTKVTSGGTPLRGVDKFFRDGRYSWFKTQELRDCVLLESEEKITDEALEESSAKLLPINTVLMAMYGDGKTITSLGLLSKEAACNQACCAMIPDQSVCIPRFLFYALKSHRDDFIQIATGGAQRNLSGRLIRRFALNIPPPREQFAIAHILGTLDDKIELSRRMNETLESMTRALFKSWFVDFDPVRAKAEGRNTGLPQNIATLFPASFAPAESEIPEGWQSKPIEELAAVSGGSTPSTKEPSYWDGGTHCWATPKDLSTLKTPVLLDTERKITDAGLAQITSGLLPAGTVLMSSRAPIGYLAVAEIPVAINQGFIAMKAAVGVSNLFLLRWVEWAHDLIVSQANGSTFLEISKSSFRPILVTTPPDSLMNEFDRIVRPLHLRMVANELSSRTLTHLRDGLLPRLLSGELRLPDAERLIGEQV